MNNWKRYYWDVLAWNFLKIFNQSCTVHSVTNFLQKLAYIHNISPRSSTAFTSRRFLTIHSKLIVFIQDGALNDAELNNFQMAVFSGPLQPEELVGLHQMVAHEMPQVKFSPQEFSRPWAWIEFDLHIWHNPNDWHQGLKLKLKSQHLAGKLLSSLWEHLCTKGPNCIWYDMIWFDLIWFDLWSVFYALSLICICTLRCCQMFMSGFASLYTSVAAFGWKSIF